MPHGSTEIPKLSDPLSIALRTDAAYLEVLNSTQRLGTAAQHYLNDTQRGDTKRVEEIGRILLDGLSELQNQLKDNRKVTEQYTYIQPPGNDYDVYELRITTLLNTTRLASRSRPTSVR